MSCKIDLPTPKNNGQINTAVKGEKYCNSNGSIQERNVNSSDKGATI